jgi:low affinity Fe/Cu permease
MKRNQAARGTRPHASLPEAKAGSETTLAGSAGTNDAFRKVAHSASLWVGTPNAFAVALVVIVAWAASGPVFGFSDTWQLVINTGTTIVTFLMVFLIQNTQNRDARAIQLKLDELIHAQKGARNRLIDLEEMSEDELNRLQKEFERIRRGR